MDAEVPLTSLILKLQYPQSNDTIWASKYAAYICNNKVKLDGSGTIKGKHLKIQVKEDDNDAPLDAIAFGFGDLQASLSTTKSFRMAYHIDLNEFRGRKRLQLIVKDTIL